MATIEKLGAYGPVLRSILNRAAQSPSGISLEMPTREAAVATRQRLYRMRQVQNRVLAKTYGEGFMGPWDDLRIVIRGERDLLVCKDETLLAGLIITDLSTGETTSIESVIEKELAEPDEPFLPFPDGA